MNAQPLVSVVMNCYNGERYLRDAIDSVYAQTYTNWELIIVDDGSSDSTDTIVRKYLSDKRIQSIQPGKIGKNSAYNLALNHR